MRPKPRYVRAKLGALMVLCASVGLVLGGSSPAEASDACQDLDETAVEVAPGLCEVAFLKSGNYSFSPPRGVTKIAAIIVGGGGGALVNADIAFGGGGGEVIFVPALDLAAPLAINVGAGGDAGDYPRTSALAGEESGIGSHVAKGGQPPNRRSDFMGGSSGSAKSGSSNGTWGAGGGAADSALGSGQEVCSPGRGMTASEAASGDFLFPATEGEPVFGEGGGCAYPRYEAGADAPGNGGDAVSATKGYAGSEGAVFLRWSLIEQAPTTGPSVFIQASWIAMGCLIAVGGMIAAGLALVLARSREASRSRASVPARDVRPTAGKPLDVDPELEARLEELNNRLQRLDEKSSSKKKLEEDY